MVAPLQIGTIPYPLLARLNRWCNRRFFDWATGLTEGEYCMLTQAGLTPDDSDVIDYLEVIKQNQAEA